MIAHKDEIYSRPKRTWFTTEKEKRLVAKASKVIFMKSFVVGLCVFFSSNVIVSYLGCIFDFSRKLW